MILESYEIFPPTGNSKSSSMTEYGRGGILRRKPWWLRASLHSTSRNASASLEMPTGGVVSGHQGETRGGIGGSACR